MKEWDKKCCFIITSCIYPSDKELCYIKTRSIFTPEERLMQTVNTIASIKEKCPTAHIILVDNGIKEPKELHDLVDEYYYIGHSGWVRYFSSTKNKSLGEWILLWFVMSKCKLEYDIVFKISGRYYLNSDFDLSNYSFSNFNFKCIARYTECDEKISGIHPPIKAVYTTRLYAVPHERLREYKFTLFLALFRIVLKGMSMETSITRGIRSPIHYMEKLGVSGNVAVDNTYHQE